MDAINSNKPFIQNNNEHRKNNMRVLTGIVGAGIPIAYSLASGIATNGNAAVKATSALGTAKGWGLFIAGAALFNKAATSVINNIKPLKDFSENHPGLTSIGLIIAGVKAGGAAVEYGNKAITKLLGNKSFEEKVHELLQKSSIFKNKTLENVAASLGNFANSTKGQFIGKAALIGMSVLFIKSIFDLGKMDYKASKAKQS